MVKQIKERPIIFNTEMVKAILDGKKFMTRRVVKLTEKQKVAVRNQTKEEWVKAPKILTYCPFGTPGEKLWVRETWLPDPPQNGYWDYYVFTDGVIYNFDALPLKYKKPKYCLYKSDWDGQSIRWRPSIHMPRWASRITLEILNVGVERVQDISEEDAISEGAKATWPEDCYPPCSMPDPSFITGFKALWDSLNAKKGFGWKDNPWLWVIEFRRV